LLYQLGVSALLGFALSIALGEELAAGPALAVLPAFLYQAVWVAGFTYVAWFAMMRRYPAVTLSAFTFLTPLFGAAFRGCACWATRCRSSFLPHFSWSRSVSIW
jgi:drug/metabolite transporter (DMT)-like permease